MKKPLIIGIAGGSASGKTTFAKVIYDNFKNTNSVITIRQDDYYKDQSHLPMEERVKTNYDHPHAFDNDLFAQNIDDLCAGKTILKPTYDFPTHNRSIVTETVHSADVIILEGLFILQDESIRNRCDIKIYVDTPNDIRFIRRLVRDVNERGRSIESVCTQYLTTVREMHQYFVEPSKVYADIIVPEGGKNNVAIDLLNTKIKSILQDR